VRKEDLMSDEKLKCYHPNASWNDSAGQHNTIASRWEQ
jgi:hypothetical protein